MDKVEYFDKHYEIIVCHLSLTSAHKVYIGDRDHRVCRYCKKTSTEVSFKKEAHAIPEFLGNKSLFSYDECDVCNKLISEAVEDHFAKYIKAYRSLAKINGKKGVPTFKGANKVSRIEAKEAGLNIIDKQDDSIVELDQSTKTIQIKTKREPYLPAAVFKCLVKMAIAVAPSDVLDKFDHLVRWILDSEHNPKRFDYKPLAVFEQFTSGPNPHKGVSVILLRRKNSDDNVPYLQFVLAFGNIMYQIIVPMPKEDAHIMGVKVDIFYYPNSNYENSSYGGTEEKRIDFSSYDTRRNEEHVLYMGYSSVKIFNPKNNQSS